MRMGRQAPTGTLGAYVHRQGVCIAHCQISAGGRPRVEILSIEPANPSGLRREIRQRGWGALPCNAVLDTDQYRLLLMEAPSVPAPELRAAMQWRLKDMIPYPAEEAVVDVFSVPPGRRAAHSNSVFVAAAQKRELDALFALLRAGGLSLRSMDIADLAAGNVAELDGMDREGVGGVYFTKSCALFSIFREGELYLTRRMGMSYADAQRAMAGGRDSQDDLLVQLSSEIRRSLEYYESYYGMPALRTLSVWPPGEVMTDLSAALGEALAMPSQVLDLASLLEIDPPALALPGSLLAIGASLRSEAAA